MIGLFWNETSSRYIDLLLFRNNLAKRLRRQKVERSTDTKTKGLVRKCRLNSLPYRTASHYVIVCLFWKFIYYYPWFIFAFMEVRHILTNLVYEFQKQEGLRIYNGIIEKQWLSVSVLSEITSVNFWTLTCCTWCLPGNDEDPSSLSRKKVCNFSICHFLSSHSSSALCSDFHVWCGSSRWEEQSAAPGQCPPVSH